VLDTDGDIAVKETVFKRSMGLWEMLTRINVNTEFNNKDYLKTYKNILMIANAHLTRYQRDGNINIMQEKNS